MISHVPKELERSSSPFTTPKASHKVSLSTEAIYQNRETIVELLLNMNNWSYIKSTSQNKEFFK